MAKEDESPDSLDERLQRREKVRDWQWQELKTEVQYLRAEQVEEKARLLRLENEVRLISRFERDTIPPAPKGISSIVPAVKRSVPQLTAGSIAATLVIIVQQLVELWMRH